MRRHMSDTRERGLHALGSRAQPGALAQRGGLPDPSLPLPAPGTSSRLLGAVPPAPAAPTCPAGERCRPAGLRAAQDGSVSPPRHATPRHATGGCGFLAAFPARRAGERVLGLRGGAGCRACHGELCRSLTLPSRAQLAPAPQPAASWPVPRGRRDGYATLAPSRQDTGAGAQVQGLAWRGARGCGERRVSPCERGTPLTCFYLSY